MSIESMMPSDTLLPLSGLPGKFQMEAEPWTQALGYMDPVISFTCYFIYHPSILGSNPPVSLSITSSLLNTPMC